MGNFFEIKGVDKVLSALGNMPNATRRKAVIPALREAAKPVKAQVIANIQSDLTEIATHVGEKSVVIRTIKAESANDVRVGVAIAGKKLNPKNQQRVGLYMSVREFGKEGQPPKPAFRPGIETAAIPAINSFEDSMGKLLDSAVEEAKR